MTIDTTKTIYVGVDILNAEVKILLPKNCNQAVMVIGMPKDLKLWREEIEKAIAGVHPEERWWYGTDTGMSSSAIFAVLALHPIKNRVERKGETPQDSDDFGRCKRLIDLIPEWKSRLDEVAKAYPDTKWPDIIARWDELVAADEDEQTKTLRFINEKPKA